MTLYTAQQVRVGSNEQGTYDTGSWKKIFMYEYK